MSQILNLLFSRGYDAQFLHLGVTDEEIEPDEEIEHQSHPENMSMLTSITRK